MYPLQRVEEQAKALNPMDVVEDKGSSSAKLDGDSEQLLYKEGTAGYRKTRGKL
jgi:hypothetical protein